jgi:hypothetical protein
MSPPEIQVQDSLSRAWLRAAALAATIALTLGAVHLAAHGAEDTADSHSACEVCHLARAAGSAPPPSACEAAGPALRLLPVVAVVAVALAPEEPARASQFIRGPPGPACL